MLRAAARDAFQEATERTLSNRAAFVEGLGWLKESGYEIDEKSERLTFIAEIGRWPEDDRGWAYAVGVEATIRGRTDTEIVKVLRRLRMNPDELREVRDVS